MDTLKFGHLKGKKCKNYAKNERGKDTSFFLNCPKLSKYIYLKNTIKIYKN